MSPKLIKPDEQYYNMNKFIIMDKFNHILSKPFIIIKNNDKEIEGQMISDTHFRSIVPYYKNIEYKLIEYDVNMNNIIFEIDFVLSSEQLTRAYKEIKNNDNKTIKIFNTEVKYNNMEKDKIDISCEFDFSVNIFDEKNKSILLTVPTFRLYKMN